MIYQIIFAGVHFILYADDANIIITGTTIKELENKINALIPKLTSWVGVNSLKLNTTKTKYMVISNTIKHDFDIVIKQSRELSKIDFLA